MRHVLFSEVHGKPNLIFRSLASTGNLWNNMHPMLLFGEYFSSLSMAADTCPCSSLSRIIPPDRNFLNHCSKIRLVTVTEFMYPPAFAALWLSLKSERQSRCNSFTSIL